MEEKAIELDKKTYLREINILLQKFRDLAHRKIKHKTSWEMCTNLEITVKGKGRVKR